MTNRGALAVWTAGVAALAVAGLGSSLLAQDGRQVIRSRADLVTSDVGIRDARGRFVADLKPYAGGGRFAEADLGAQLAELTRAANRANVSIYTMCSPNSPAGSPP